MKTETLKREILERKIGWKIAHNLIFQTKYDNFTEISENFQENSRFCQLALLSSAKNVQKSPLQNVNYDVEDESKILDATHF